MTTLILMIGALGGLALLLRLFELTYDYLEARLAGRFRVQEANPSSRAGSPQTPRPASRDEQVAHMAIWPTTGRRVKRL